jgi:hypothetical protein
MFAKSASQLNESRDKDEIKEELKPRRSLLMLGERRVE